MVSFLGVPKFNDYNQRSVTLKIIVIRFSTKILSSYHRELKSFKYGLASEVIKDITILLPIECCFLLSLLLYSLPSALLRIFPCFLLPHLYQLLPHHLLPQLMPELKTVPLSAPSASALAPLHCFCFRTNCSPERAHSTRFRPACHLSPPLCSALSCYMKPMTEASTQPQPIDKGTYIIKFYYLYSCKIHWLKHQSLFSFFVTFIYFGGDGGATVVYMS